MGHMASAEGIVVDIIIGVGVFVVVYGDGMERQIARSGRNHERRGGERPGIHFVVLVTDALTSELEDPSLPRKVEQLMERLSPNHTGSQSQATNSFILQCGSNLHSLRNKCSTHQKSHAWNLPYRTFAKCFRDNCVFKRDIKKINTYLLIGAKEVQ